MKKLFKPSVIAIFSFTLFVVVAIGVAVGLVWYRALPAEIPISEDAKAQILTTLKTVNTAEVDYAMGLTMAVELDPQYGGGAGAQTITSEATGKGKMDFGNKALELELSLNVEDQVLPFAQIVLGDTFYIKALEEGYKKYTTLELQQSEFGGTAISVQAWEQQQIWTQAENADFIDKGEEVVDGRQTRKYKLNLSEDAFSSYIGQSETELIAAYHNYGIEVTADDIKFSTKDAKAFVWVDTQTGLPVKQDVQLGQAKLQVIGVVTINVTNLRTQVDYQKVNQPVTIAAPAVS